MKSSSRLLILLSLVSLSVSVGQAKEAFSAQPQIDQPIEEKVEVVELNAPTCSTTAGVKKPFVVKRGDCELTIGGKARIEHFYEDAMSLLNKNIPDQNEYFKHTIDLSLGFGYGKEKYCHPAVEMMTVLRSKNVWGLPARVADKDASGSVGQANVLVAESLLKPHAHTTGKPLVWMKEGWLKFSLNAIADCPTEAPHTIKIGYFPFEMGRGIAFGAAYGLNREFLGIYSYIEDKGAPGILLHGDIVKDHLSYDLYYAKFEERSKGFSDTINLEKAHIVGRSDNPWRGINKDDEAFAARLKASTGKNCCFGKLDIEPYVFYNAASDQKVEIAPDAKTNWGSYGVSLEHCWNGFEWGGEIAFNYGRELLFNIDRNVSQIVNDGTGDIVERYSKVADDMGVSMPVNKTNRAIVLANQKTTDGHLSTLDQNGLPTGISSGYKNKNDRFRPSYKNRFEGWMGVIDAAYTIKALDLKLALAAGYASGDANPHSKEVNKGYKGFVGLHEVYCGKRVTSVALLDMRLLMRPESITEDATNVKVGNDLFFSDLIHVGGGLTWTPSCRIKDLSINPNALAFWKAHRSHKVTFSGNNDTYKATVSPEKASTFMGTEFNIISKFSLLPDLNVFINFAMFVPGQFFTDLAGVPLSSDFFDKIAEDPRNDLESEDITDFRLSDETALHLNIGFEYRF